MSDIDTTAPPTVAELVAASVGREGTMLRVLRDAAAQIEENIRERIAADAHALGVAPDALARLLEGGVGAPVAEPAKRQRAAKPVLAPNTTEITLRELLFAELDKGPASALALSRRTGATKERVTANLTNAANSSPPLARLNGLKWSRVTS